MTADTTYSVVQPSDADTIIRAYREDHRIDPEYPRGTRYSNYCRHDGITIREVKGGYRHDASEVARLVGQMSTRSAR